MDTLGNIGPTKRSADFNDYVELESKLAKAEAEIVRLKDYNKKLLNVLQSKDTRIKDLESNDSVNSPDIVILINDYVTLRDTASKLREENNKKSANFNTTGESGSYNTPANVIDAGLNWTRKSIEICNKLASRILKK